MRQLGQGIRLFETTYRYIPGNGGYDKQSKIRAKNGDLIEISTEDFAAALTYQWGIGRPDFEPYKQPASWGYSILPYVEQQKAYSEVSIESHLPIFLCPSRARRRSAATVNDEYGNYVSGEYAWTKTDYNANLRVCPHLPQTPLSLSSVRDGTSNTLLFGEKAFDYTVHKPTTWYWDESIFAGGTKGTARAGLVIVNDGANIPYKENWGSAHPNKINLVRLDGSTDSLSNTIDRFVLRDLLTLDSPMRR